MYQRRWSVMLKSGITTVIIRKTTFKQRIVYKIGKCYKETGEIVDRLPSGRTITATAVENVKKLRIHRVHEQGGHRALNQQGMPPKQSQAEAESSQLQNRPHPLLKQWRRDNYRNVVAIWSRVVAWSRGSLPTRSSLQSRHLTNIRITARRTRNYRRYFYRKDAVGLLQA